MGDAYQFKVKVQALTLAVSSMQIGGKCSAQMASCYIAKSLSTTMLISNPLPGPVTPINLAADQAVIVRAHMHTTDPEQTGYEACKAGGERLTMGLKWCGCLNSCRQGGEGEAAAAKMSQRMNSQSKIPKSIP